MVQNMSKVDQKRSKGNMTLDQNMSNVGQKCPDCTKNSPCSYHQIQVKCDHCHYIFECSQRVASDSHIPIFARVSYQSPNDQAINCLIPFYKSRQILPWLGKLCLTVGVHGYQTLVGEEEGHFHLRY